MGMPRGDWKSAFQPGYQPPRPKNIWLYWLLGGFCILVVGCGGLALLAYSSATPIGSPTQQLTDDEQKCSDLGDAGNYKDAIPHCRAVVKSQPSSGLAHNNLGWFLLLDGQVQEGLKECQQSVNLQDDPASTDSFSMALALNNRGEEALKNEQPLLKDIDDNPGRYITLGMIYYSLNRKPEAHKAWDQAIDKCQPNDVHLARRFREKYR